MATNRGLGKGLGALIQMFDDDNAELQRSSITAPRTTGRIDDFIGKEEKVSALKVAMDVGLTGVAEIELSLIDSNSAQPRKHFEHADLVELSDSIRAHGILQPILVKRVGTRFMIIAGERRWRAAAMAGLKTIPAMVRDYTARQISEIALVENLQRAELNEIEIAQGIRSLMDTYYLTQEQVSSVLGKNRSSIANSLRLLGLPKEVQLLLQQNKITLGHAKCLAAVTDAEACINLANRCADGRLSVRDLEALLMKTERSDTKAIQKSQSLEIKDLARALSNSFGTKVVIQGTDKTGKVIIQYYSKDELETIKSKIK